MPPLAVLQASARLSGTSVEDSVTGRAGSPPTHRSNPQAPDGCVSPSSPKSRAAGGLQSQSSRSLWRGLISTRGVRSAGGMPSLPRPKAADSDCLRECWIHYVLPCLPGPQLIALQQACRSVHALFGPCGVASLSANLSSKFVTSPIIVFKYDI